MKLKIFIVFYFIINLSIYAQYVEFDEINGNLSDESSILDNKVKYKGFEFPLNEGEIVNFIVSSNDFLPNIILIDPNGNVFKKTNSKNNFASLITKIPSSGIWIIYVIGGKNDFGKFNLKYAISLYDFNFYNFDFCSGINFLISHANAYFMLLVNDITQYKIESCGNLFINEKGELIFEYNDNSFSVLFNKLKNCIPDWENISNKNSVLFYDKNQTNVQILIYSEKDKLFIKIWK
ncbi:MAG: hypothetical protein N2321_08805 [Melioribacteraceae bacterium]|nr:hypothetical protein [Melioribacteraceae bacterium]